MPELQSFVRIVYIPKGPAAPAIRLLNEDLRINGLEPKEARLRIQNFVKGKAHAHDTGLPSAPAFVDHGNGMRLRRPNG